MLRFIRPLLVPMTLLAGLGPVMANDRTEEAPPTKHEGLSSAGSMALPLGAQIPAMEGYQARVQTIAMAPGGIVALHSHKDRPGAYYLVRGSRVVEHRGTEQTIVAPGTIVLEGRDVEHWVRNEGDEAVLVAFSIVPL